MNLLSFSRIDWIGKNIGKKQSFSLSFDFCLTGKSSDES